MTCNALAQEAQVHRPVRDRPGFRFLDDARSVVLVAPQELAKIMLAQSIAFQAYRRATPSS
jgi:hypothetical protein